MSCTPPPHVYRFDSTLSDLLHQLASISSFPLPKDTTPTTAPRAPNSHKRGREDDDAVQYPRSPAPPVQYPPYENDHLSTNTHYPAPPTFTSASVNAPQPAQQFCPLPTYTADLGKLPVFHQRELPLTSTSSWYPTQSPAPLGRPDFTVAVAPPDNGAANIADVFAVDPLFASDGGYSGMGAPGMNSDVMAMWANAPTSFEVDDWGVYLNVMSELVQGLDAPGLQP